MAKFTQGTTNFQAVANEVMNMLEPLISQSIESATLNNPLSDSNAIYFHDCKSRNGRSFEQSIVKAAESRGFVFVHEGEQPNFEPVDPTIYTRYFDKWDKRQFRVSTREDEIRAVIADKGATREEASAKIVNSLTQGDNKEDFLSRRKMILESPVANYATIAGGKVPKNIDGVLVMARDMYNHLKANNSDCTVPAFDCATPAADIRVAITEKLMNLIDVTKLANIFNLSKAELFGKLVVINVDDLPKSQQYQLVVYDHKAMNCAEYILEYGFEIFKLDRYINHALTAERMYFYSSLFKACKLDCSVAAAAAENGLLEAEKTFTVTPTLNAVATLTNENLTVGTNMPFVTGVVPVPGKALSDITVTVNMGGDITAEVYDEEEGIIAIPAVTAAVTVTANDMAKKK